MRSIFALAALAALVLSAPASADPTGRTMVPFVDSGSVTISGNALVLSATGHAMTGGWSDQVVYIVIPTKQKPANGVYTVTVEGRPPKGGMVNQAVTPFTTNPVGWPGYPSDLKAVRFVAAGNTITVQKGTTGGGDGKSGHAQ
jgi:hypothetical protein